MSFERVHYLPILISVWFPFTFILTYLIAVLKNDVTPLFPYISDTGTFTPESCIFGQMLNLGALLMAMVGYVRYLQLRDLIENNELPGNIERLNKISLITGVLAALGISIVGNFQEYNALPVHLTGAILAFGVGGVYASIQTYISFKIHPILGNKVVNWVRVILSASTFLFFFSTMGFAAAAYEASDNVDQIVAKWKHGEPGWELHFVSTASEWILAFSLISFLTTYTHEFKSLSWTSPSVKHKFK